MILENVKNNIGELVVTRVEVIRKHKNGYLREIKVRRDDNDLYTFKECDFPRLCINEIKDMLILIVQNRLINLSEEEPANFAFMDFSSSSSSSDNGMQPSGRYHAVPPPITGTFMTPKPNLSKPVFNTVLRPVSAVVPKIIVTRPRLAHSPVTKSKSPIRRHITRSPSTKTSNSPPKVTAVKAPVELAEYINTPGWNRPAFYDDDDDDDVDYTIAITPVLSTEEPVNSLSLESVEARLVVYKQNESILEENIQLLKQEVQARDNVLVTLKQKLNQAEQEKDDLKLKLDKFQSSSKNLTELLASQTNEKHGSGYFTLESDYESLSPSSLSDRMQPSGGYHVVPLPITGTFMPPKPDLVFHTVPIAAETDHSAFTVQLSTAKPTQDLFHTNRPSVPIIEEWVSDSEDESETTAPQIASSFVQPVSVAVPKIMVTRPRLAHSHVTKSKSPIRWHITRGPSPKTSNSPPKVTAVKALVVSAAQGEESEIGKHRMQPSGGYHAVPPPITGTFKPPKPDLVFYTAPIAVGKRKSRNGQNRIKTEQKRKA
nr:hypothetical protein [Tanacetum cinerariifolium]